MALFDRFRGKRKRVVLIGLDGTPYTLAKRFIEDGTMPRLAEITRNGSLLQMDTSIPDISSVAWASFMTGSNPGRHGIFGFVDLQAGSYKQFFPNSSHLKVDTLWDVLSKAGRRSVVINVPSTYPARPLNGILVSGFVAIDLNKATYPPALVPKLREMKYRIDVDASKARESLDALMEDIVETLDRRVEALLWLFDNEEWDLFVGVITSTDRLQHFFWDAIEDPAHKYHQAFRDYYRRVDDFLGQVTGRLGDEILMIMSDHGFTGIKKQVYLNRWLADNGYLKLKENARSIEDIAEGSLAFVLDPGRVFVNIKGKYPSGCVAPSDARTILDEIKQGVEAITADGQQIVKKAYEREEIYSGPCIASAPDLCVQPIYGYDFKGSVNKQQLMDRDLFTGMHTQDDATFFISLPQELLKAKRPNITDVAPTALEAIGIEPAVTMEGKSLLK